MTVNCSRFQKVQLTTLLKDIIKIITMIRNNTLLSNFYYLGYVEPDILIKPYKKIDLFLAHVRGSKKKKKRKLRWSNNYPLDFKSYIVVNRIRAFCRNSRSWQTRYYVIIAHMITIRLSCRRKIGQFISIHAYEWSSE